MRILITGVAGLVGSNLAKSMPKDVSIIGIDNLVGGYKDNIPTDIEFIKLDVSDISHELLSDVDIVVHAACTAHEGLSVFSPDFITKNTFSNSVKLLQESIKAGVKKFIFLSSMARYGKQDQFPFIESMIPNPVDPYGISKVAFENVLKMMSSVHGIQYSILVPHNIIGNGQVYTDPFRNVAGIMINRMLQGKQPVIYGSGDQMRGFSDIRDVIDPIKKVIFSSIADSEVVNIGPDENFITINHLAEIIADEIGFELDPIYLEDRPAEVKFANCSADKARKLLGYSTTFDIRSTVSDMIEWVSYRGPGDFDFDSIPVEIINSNTPKTWSDRSIFNG